MSTATRVVLAALTLELLALPAQGQERAPGWIGISFEITNDRTGADVLIADVVVGSPAQEAGLRAGDRLLAVNELDRPSEMRELSQRLRIREGDLVRLIIERGGERREVRLRAAERPAGLTPSRRVELTLQPDSMVETMVRAMDSLRVRLEGVGRRVGVGTAPRVPVDRTGVTVVTPPGAASVRAPFEFFLFRGVEHDSLRQEMEELNEVMADLQRRIERRDRQLARSSRPPQPRGSAGDAELTRLRVEMEGAARRSSALRAAMAEAARETAGVAYGLPATDPDAPPGGAPGVEQFRPLTPYLLGRNRVAGAEVIDLRPELAAYFDGVEGGVLVVDVAPRTPAAISGIVPGDVITRMDQVAVRSVEDLRFGISQARDTLPLTLVRRGSSLQVLLRR